MSLSILVSLSAIWGRRPDEPSSISKMMEFNFAILAIGWLLRWSEDKFPYPWCVLSTYDLSSKSRIKAGSDSRYGIIYDMLVSRKRTVEIGRGGANFSLINMTFPNKRVQLTEQTQPPLPTRRKKFDMWRNMQILWLWTIVFSYKTSKCY